LELLEDEGLAEPEGLLGGLGAEDEEPLVIKSKV